MEDEQTGISIMSAVIGINYECTVSANPAPRPLKDFESSRLIMHSTQTKADNAILVIAA
jgi:hypothetical protein